LFLSTLLSACSRYKSLQKKDKNIAAEKLVHAIQREGITQKNVQLKLKGLYKTSQEEINFSMNLRLKRDSLVWASIQVFGIEVARALFTKDSMYVINKIEKEYLCGGNHLISKFLGFQMGPLELQNLLLGKSIFDINDYQFITDSGIEATIFKGKIKNILSINSDFLLNESSIESIGLKEPFFGKIKYLEHMLVEEKLCPKNIQMEINSGENALFVDLKILKISMPEQQKFPFKIPNHYKKVND